MRKVIKYAEEVIQELGRVSWPTKEELQESTIVVCVFAIILALFVLFADQVISAVLNGIMG
jgi:preprotein translocase subunit SecE